MITLGNNKAMRTFQKPTMFESFSELEHNRIDSQNDGQLVENGQQSVQAVQSMQSAPAVSSRTTLAGSQKANFRSGSRVKVRTTLISISPPDSPTNHPRDTGVSRNSNPATNSSGTSTAGCPSKDQQTQLINYSSPSQNAKQMAKKHLVRCESVDSISQMNGYSSVSSCSTVINRPTASERSKVQIIQKANWDVLATGYNNKIALKYQLEEEDTDSEQQQQQQDKSTRANGSYHSASSTTTMMKQSKTADNLSGFMQPQQAHQTHTQFRQVVQQTGGRHLNGNAQRTKDKAKDQATSPPPPTVVQTRTPVCNQSTGGQSAGGPPVAKTVRTPNIVNTNYALPQLTTQPLIAIRRILLLYENLQYKETAQFVSRLPPASFQLILRDLPVGLFIEQMPQSLVVLEALYAKLYASLQELNCLYTNGALIVSSTQLATLPELNPNQTVNHTIGRNLLKLLQPESVTMHLVKMHSYTFALKGHGVHSSIYECGSSPSSSTNGSHSSHVSNGVFALMQERFDNNHPVMVTTRKLLKTILTIQPPISKQLAARKRAIDNAIDAMGHHGLVSTGNTTTNQNGSSSASSSSASSTASSTSNATSAGSPVNGCASSLDGNSVLMMSLHEALKLEFDFVITQYKQASSKLDEAISSAISGKQLTPMKFTLRNLSKLPAPSSASHQRQLSLRPDEIQLRLMRNKALLNSLEQYVLNQHSVQILMGILEQRINYDRETLFQFTQLRKEFNYCCTLSQQLASSFGGGTAAHGHTSREPNATMVSGCVHNGEMQCCIDANAIVAPVLMRFSYGCGQVLRIFDDISAEMQAQAELDAAAAAAAAESKNKTENGEAIETNNSTDAEKTAVKSEENGGAFCTEQQPEVDQVSQINSKTVIINSQQTNFKEKPDDVKRVEQLDSEETRQSSSDISGYHSDENTDYLLNGSIKSGQQNSGYLDGKRGSQSRHFFSSRSSSSPLSSASYSSSCSSDLRNEDLNKKSISQNLVEIASSQHHDLTNVETPISYLDNEQNETCWTPPQQSRYSDNELIILKRELIRSKQTIFELQEREQQLLMKLKAKQQQPSTPQDLLTDSTNSIPKLMPDALTPMPFSPEKRRPCALIRKFGDLYSQARVDTLDSLNLIEQLKDADELKSKLLFSVVVLSFRSVQKTITEIKQKICTLLQIYDCDQPNQSAIKQLETAINVYLKSNVDSFDTTQNLEEVCNQIWSTLYDYPCLKESAGLNNYIVDCIKLAWALSVQTPAYLIKYNSKVFSADDHVRHHISDSSSSHIKNYLWPALIEEGESGVCVHKGVVIT